MRYITLGLGLSSFLLLGGCNSFPPFRGGGTPQPVARVPTETPRADDLVDYLNRNASHIQSLDCRELDLEAKQGLQSIGLRGWLVCQKQRNFRLAAKIVGNQAVDIGSNDHEFWFWISKADPPDLYHCSYEDVARGTAQMPFPFQPEWIMQALGMSEYKASENYKVNVTPTTLELVESTVSPQGRPIRKVTVFTRVTAQGTAPQVTAYLLQDSNGKEICGAYITEVQYDRAHEVVLPRRIRLTWPAQKMELKLKLDEVVVNDRSIEPRAARLFTRPNLANIRSIDLARIPDPPIQRTGGLIRH